MWTGLWLTPLILSASIWCGVPQCDICEMCTGLKDPQRRRSRMWSPLRPPLSSFLEQGPNTPPVSHFSRCLCRDGGQDSDLCSLWHPDFPLAAPGAALWPRSCGASCPRSAAAPSAGCWTRLRTGSSTCPPLCHHSRSPPPWARACWGWEGGTRWGP